MHHKSMNTLVTKTYLKILGLKRIQVQPKKTFLSDKK